MGVSKTDLFTNEQNDIAAIAKCIAHPARVAILQYLLKKNSCVNTTLVGEIGLAQATISQHLSELKSVGIIQGTIEGKTMNYCINPTMWSHMKEMFNVMFDQHPCCHESDCC